MTLARNDVKLFVLDTNVILHDAGCLRNFAEHDVVVPLTVLEELDRFKKGNEDLHFQARAFLEQVAGVGKLPPVPSFAHGLRNLRLLAAVAESARRGGVEITV